MEMVKTIFRYCPFKLCFDYPFFQPLPPQEILSLPVTLIACSGNYVYFLSFDYFQLSFIPFFFFPLVSLLCLDFSISPPPLYDVVAWCEGTPGVKLLLL